LPLDHYVTLGRSGLAVSPFRLGAMTFGEDWGWGSNLGALDVRLPAEAKAALDEASKPTLSFPVEFVRGSGMFKRGGTTVNGETAPPWPLAPKTDGERH